MKFLRFSEFLKRIEDTTKRLEITDILRELITELEEDEIDKGMYLALGYLKAPFESLKFNMADKMMLRVIENTYSSTLKNNIKDKINTLYQETGDLGSVIYSIAQKDNDFDLTLTDVYQQMTEIAQCEGANSQELKVNKTTNLLKKLDNLSAKYCTRIILGTTRLGFTELTLIDALSNYIGKTKQYRESIEKKYNLHPDVGLIAKHIKQGGIKGIEDIAIETGVPVLSQKAQRVEGGLENVYSKMNTAWAEYKFDGTRVQLHFDKDKLIEKDKNQKKLMDFEDKKYLIRTFTRNLEETTHQYPDIAESAKKQINASSVILDGEAIGFNKETGSFLAFQETIKRKRKHNVEQTIIDIPIKYYVFDILYLNGKSLIDLPLSERNSILKKVITINSNEDIINIAEHLETKEKEELKKYYDSSVDKNLEGIIVKNPSDPYQAGARSFSWIKIKRADQTLLDDSIECTVLGYYFGKGDRSKFGIGGFLAGVYDKETDTFKSITKVGTGLKDKDFITLKKIADKNRISKPLQNIILDKVFTPDVYLKPSIVVEIGADEISVSPTHSTGYALRFPRLIKFRDDKSPLECTTLKEIEMMFKSQKVKKQT